MSTTKDKSRGPYTVERIEMKGRDWWTVTGPNAGGTPIDHSKVDVDKAPASTNT